jgi:thioesterase domain-containing protein
MSLAEDAELELIQDTLNYMPKKVTYLMPQKTIVPLNQTELFQVGDCKPVPVVIVYPVECSITSLKNLCKHIEAPVYGFSCAQAMHTTNVEELAQYCVSKIQAQFGPQCVHLIGYDFGSLVALEMASTKANQFVSLALIDDNTPTRRQTTQPEILEINALFEFSQKYLQSCTAFELYRQLQTVKTSTQRIKCVVRELMNKSNINFDQIDLEYALRACINQKFMQNQYVPIQTIRLPYVTLIKSNEQLGLVQIKSKLQSFLEACNANTVENYVNCDLESLMKGKNASQVAAILNENFLFL